MSTIETIKAGTSAEFMQASAPRSELYALISTLKDSVLRLQGRIADLEAGLVIGNTYHGVWQRSAPYLRAGILCSHQGGLWHLNEPVSPGVEPGTSRAWSLCSKRGEEPRPQLATAGKRVNGNEPRPRRGKVEKTIVTKYDGQGRIAEFLKEEVVE